MSLIRRPAISETRRPQPHDDSQHHRRHPDPHRPRQPDRKSAGFRSAEVAGGHAVRILPADGRVNAKHSDTQTHVSLIQTQHLESGQED